MSRFKEIQSIFTVKKKKQKRSTVHFNKITTTNTLNRIQTQYCPLCFDTNKASFSEPPPNLAAIFPTSISPLTFFLYPSHSLLPRPPHFSLFLTMAQVVASRSIQSTPLCPTSGSARDRTQNLLKPPSFASKVFPLGENNNKRSKLRLRSLQISARKSAPSEVIPMSPEDDPKVRVFCIF